MSAPLVHPSLPFYRVSVQEHDCDFRDSKTNMFDHFESYDFTQIAAMSLDELKQSTVSPFVCDYPVMRIFIVRNDTDFPLRITITMLYTEIPPDNIHDTVFAVVHQMSGLSTLQLCVSNLAGDVLHIFSNVQDLNEFLFAHKFPAITSSSVQYTGGMALIFNELNIAPVLARMTDWLCSIRNHSMCDMNKRVYAKIRADAASMGLWIDHIVYALYMCMSKADYLDEMMDTMLDALYVNNDFSIDTEMIECDAAEVENV
jgi:hypothetical protein